MMNKKRSLSESLVLIDQSNKDVALFLEWLETIAGKRWLQTSKGVKWVQRHADWLHTDTGKWWLETSIGQAWLTSFKGFKWQRELAENSNG